MRKMSVGEDISCVWYISQVKSSLLDQICLVFAVSHTTQKVKRHNSLTLAHSLITYFSIVLFALLYEIIKASCVIDYFAPTTWIDIRLDWTGLTGLEKSEMKKNRKHSSPIVLLSEV